MISFKKIEKELYHLGIPKNIKIPKVSMLDQVTYMILMSERKAAKTTNFLLTGLILTRDYNIVTQYVRLRRDFITTSKIERIYDVIKEYDYIKKIFGNTYDDILYDKFKRTFYLSKNGEKLKECCTCIAVEDAESYKSGYNAPYGDFIILDEFLTHRERLIDVDLFFDLLSTIIRDRSECKIVLLGNIIKRNSYFFDKMEITKDVRKMRIGENKKLVTNFGTRLYLEKIKIDDDEKKTRYISEYFGFKDVNASITGYDDFDLKKNPTIKKADRKIFAEIVLKINDIDYISIYICNSDIMIVRCTNYLNKKIYGCDRFDDSVIYGLPKKIKKILENAYKKNKLFFSSDIIADDFFNFLDRLRQQSC